jgi:UDP-GlcNAc:undecaprenyl-phosphate/decaprenyl-phosphate GlcNAc-1-phosphate transferase
MDWEIFVTTLIVTCLAAFILSLTASRWGLIDRPNGRKQHETATPMVGGIAVFAGLLSIAFTNLPVFIEFALIISLALLMLVLGILDDAHSLTSEYRLFVQLIAGLTVYIFGDLQFNELGHLWFLDTPLETGIFALPLTLIAIVGGINAINWMDGLDGLVGGMLTSTLIFIAILAWLSNSMITYNFSLVVIAALIGFLLFNYRFPWNKKARIFMGDAGAYPLAFIVVALFLKTSQPPETILPPVLALWIIAVPLFDMTRVIWLRLRLGKLPLSDDRLHIHHLLIDGGRPHRHVVNMLCSINFLIGLVGVTLHMSGVNEGWLFILLLLLLVLYYKTSNKFSLSLDLRIQARVVE